MKKFSTSDSIFRNDCLILILLAVFNVQCGQQCSSEHWCEAWLPLSRLTQWHEAPSTVLFLHMTFVLCLNEMSRCDDKSAYVRRDTLRAVMVF